MYVENLNGAKNQFIVYTRSVIYFQSYETPIAVYIKDSKKLFIKEEKYSQTTTKYTNKFIREVGDIDEVKYVSTEEFNKMMWEIQK
jgi:hypothetical protein|nr:MAG TPA: hypothetical protein [Caudoviricetes sp.]